MELGIFVGTGNEQGARIPVESAEEHVFGLCLLNDWSARDIQSWESAPLGPFLAKNFATTLSPWIVTMEALAPYRAPWTRSEGEPQPLPYLSSADTYESGAMDIQLEVTLETQETRRSGMSPTRLSRTSFRHQYWTVAQMVTHHTSNGCNLRPGDLLGSGTVSGSAPDSHGCLLELTRRGDAPVSLPSGESRLYLEDGDEVTLRGYCERQGHARIGFGECRGLILT